MRENKDYCKILDVRVYAGSQARYLYDSLQ